MLFTAKGILSAKESDCEEYLSADGAEKFSDTDDPQELILLRSCGDLAVLRS
jgi:hypothetical protein